MTVKKMGPATVTWRAFFMENPVAQITATKTILRNGALHSRLASVSLIAPSEIMEYKNLPATERPSSAPSTFTVFDVGDEKYIFCPIRNRAYKVNEKPEEIVRQWWIYRLRDVYNYDFAQLEVEVSVKVGSAESKKKADIVVYTDK